MFPKRPWSKTRWRVDTPGSAIRQEKTARPRRFELGFTAIFVEAMKVQCRRIAAAVAMMAVSAFGASQSIANAQPAGSADYETLRLNQPITRHLAGGASHWYRLPASARMFVKLSVLQKGVNVSVQAFDPQRKRLAVVDDSLGRVGPQDVEFLTDGGEGSYLIQVSARTEEVGGNYEIVFVTAREPTRDDRIRVTARTHISIGNAHRSRPSADSNLKALAEYVKARSLYRQLNDVAGQAMALQYSGRIYETQSNYARALEFYSQALTFWKQLNDHRGEALALKSIGSMHVFLGNLQAALPLLQQSAELHRLTGDQEGEALAYHETANIHFQKGEFTRALEHFERAEKLYRTAGTKGLLGYLLSNMGEAYRGIGQLKIAADHQNQALSIFRAINRPHGIATGLVYLGLVYAEQGEARKAISFYEQAVPLCASLEEQDCEARAYNFLGAAHASLAEPQTALDYYGKSIMIYRQRGQLLGLIRTLNSSGALYARLGESARARDSFNEALLSARKSQNRLEEATALRNLAELSHAEGEVRVARARYQQALNIDRAVTNRLGEALTLTGLGLLLISERQTTEAIKIFAQALSINRELGAKPDEALTLHNLGLAADGEADGRAALDYFEKALRIFRETENKQGEAMTLYRLAAVQRKLGNREDARKNVTQALAVAEMIRGKLASTDLRSSYFATVQHYYDLYIHLLVEEDRAQPGKGFDLLALKASEQARARSLLDLLREAKADLRRDVDPRLLARERELIELINGKTDQQQRAFSDPRKAELTKVLSQELNGLSLELETLQARIRQSNPRYAELVSTRPMGLADMQKLLEPDTVLLEYKLADERSYVWQVTPTAVQTFELAPRADIDNLARQFYQSLTARNQLLKSEIVWQRKARIDAADKQVDAISERLHELLLAPLGSSIAGKRLVIVADGALQYVPFAALLTDRPSTATGASPGREVVFLPSVSVLSCRLIVSLPSESVSLTIASVTFFVELASPLRKVTVVGVVNV